jgi:regulator of protease activity HflC (stomatin/prohibitin superfamily)
MLRRSLRRLTDEGHDRVGAAAAANRYYYYPPPQHGGAPPSLYSAPRVPVDPSTFIEPVPRNGLFNIVPQGRQYVVERLGKYQRTLDPGWWIVVPMLERIRYVYNTKEQGIPIPNQSAITRDNVIVEIDGVLFLRIVDPEKASYNIENPIYQLINLAQTTMRSEIGKLKLDTLFEERANLNVAIVQAIQKEAWEWGVECKRYEIRDIQVSDIVRQSMDLQAEAERRKRKLVLESEGDSQAETNRAEGKKNAQVQLADANKYSVERKAEAEAEATRVLAKATAESVEIVANAIRTNKDVADQVLGLRVAEKYITEFGKIAKEGNTVVLSNQVSDPAAFATQAMAIYGSAAKKGIAPVIPALPQK